MSHISHLHLLTTSKEQHYSFERVIVSLELKFIKYHLPITLQFLSAVYAWTWSIRQSNITFLYVDKAFPPFHTERPRVAYWGLENHKSPSGACLLSLKPRSLLITNKLTYSAENITIGPNIALHSKARLPPPCKHKLQPGLVHAASVWSG